MFNETENYNWRLDFVLVFQRKDNIYVQVRVNRTQTVNKRKKNPKKKTFTIQVQTVLSQIITNYFHICRNITWYGQKTCELLSKSLRLIGDWNWIR